MIDVWCLVPSRKFVMDASQCVTGRLLPRRFRFDAGDEFFVVDKAVEEVVPLVG